MSEICEDCNQPQPASTSTMAHSPSPPLLPNNDEPTTSTSISTSSNSAGTSSSHSIEKMKLPVPVDPPSKAAHATEMTMTGPPTPQLKAQADAHADPQGEAQAQAQTQTQTQNQTQSQNHSGEKEMIENEIKAPILENIKPKIVIEFCDRCRWAPRATWIQTELFLTFPNPLIQSITLVPLNAPETGGRFRVWVDIGIGKGDELVWDRKTEGGFPELKILKQRIRNLIQPEMGLGHSDVHGKNDKIPQETGLAN
ncbi:uncharacterized protein IL334_004418 [Kwoniella shivajii]|uniref:Selenoprotein W n=1 Tax=Kwoniella shivajii TaxID=564305 RepID=A0ABZ1D091_9TREE|nr:hypothetical protein IL334_004418 [Kwoniella shivajii]